MHCQRLIETLFAHCDTTAVAKILRTPPTNTKMYPA